MVVRAQMKPGQPWKEYRTRPLEGLAGFQPGSRQIPLSACGGRLDRKGPATGFCRVTREGERWWLVDPEGCLLMHIGVASVNPGKSRVSQEALQRLYGRPERWGEAALGLLRANGFNGTGAWSMTDAIRQAPQPVLYTCIWNFMSSFGRAKKLTHQQPGHTGYVEDCMPVLHPEFPAFCEEQARKLEATRDDPWLLGHFSDNELPAPRDLLDRHLRLDSANPDLAPGRRGDDAVGAVAVVPEPLRG